MPRADTPRSCMLLPLRAASLSHPRLNHLADPHGEAVGLGGEVDQLARGEVHPARRVTLHASCAKEWSPGR